MESRWTWQAGELLCSLMLGLLALALYGLRKPRPFYLWLEAFRYPAYRYSSQIAQLNRDHEDYYHHKDRPQAVGEHSSNPRR